MKNVESKKKLSMGMKNGSVTKIRKHYQTFTCWITILCLLCGYDCCDDMNAQQSQLGIDPRSLSTILGPGSQVGIEPRSWSTILGPGSQVGIEPRSRSTILGPSTILGAERWLQSLLDLRYVRIPLRI